MFIDGVSCREVLLERLRHKFLFVGDEIVALTRITPRVWEKVAALAESAFNTEDYPTSVGKSPTLSKRSS